MKTHTFTCIVCPLSCNIDLVEGEHDIIEITGHLCQRGEKYVFDEFKSPVRILTTTVGVEGGVLPVIPVRSDRPIPKASLKKSMKTLNTIQVKAPIKCGEIIFHNIEKTGVNIIASRDLAQITPQEPD